MKLLEADMPMPMPLFEATPGRAPPRSSPAALAPPAKPLQAQCRIDSPLGPLTLAASAAGLTAVRFDHQAHHPGELDAPEAPDHPHLLLAARELDAYFRGQLQRFSLPLDPQGTAFQQAVWQALLQIDSGQLSTYGAVARGIGRPNAVRAVGAAIGRNPLGIVVPCHRVVGHNGSLTGYAGGLPRKVALLQLEGAALTAQALR
ncbi:MAG: methylated-DNA--[protein]-cysteine S-methyltransferase [Pseudomonadota bacterium]|nr:methylated-DNA--[protein]-cysteine S-methyltransferase [Pseudomonadota bacterium]